MATTTKKYVRLLGEDWDKESIYDNAPLSVGICESVKGIWGHATMKKVVQFVAF